MKTKIKKIDGFFRKIIQFEQNIGGVLLFIMLVICFGAVIMRYFVGKPLVWSDEVILILLAILGYLAISLDVYRDAHVALTIVYNKIPRKYQKVLDLVRHLLIGFFYSVVVYQLVPIITIKSKKLLAATRWSQAVPYFFVFFFCVLMILFCIMNFVKVLADIDVEDSLEEEGVR